MKIKNILWVLAVLSLIIAGLYRYSPQVHRYGYSLAYNKKDFEKVVDYYLVEGSLSRFSKEQMIAMVSEQSEIKDKIKAKDVVVLKDSTTGKWFVEFPYELQNIYILAPTGSTIYVDNEKVVQAVMGNRVEIKDLLPGRHQIRIQYNTDGYPDFTQEVNLPKENSIESPYNTIDISVFAPSRTWVNLAGHTKQSEQEQVVFNNVLPGQYQISLFTEDKKLEVFSRNIQVDKQNTNIHIENVELNDSLKEELVGFFAEFSQAYEQGIKIKDTTFLHKFSVDKINDGLISDFKMWYIDNKDIKDAKSLMEIGETQLLSGNQLRASVLETVYLTNLEKDGDNQDVEQQYRVVIEWDYSLSRNNSMWKIIKREIRQSIVAYKNSKGNWIVY